MVADTGFVSIVTALPNICHVVNRIGHLGPLFIILLVVFSFHGLPCKELALFSSGAVDDFLKGWWSGVVVVAQIIRRGGVSRGCDEKT